MYSQNIILFSSIHHKPDIPLHSLMETVPTEYPSPFKRKRSRNKPLSSGLENPQPSNLSPPLLKKSFKNSKKPHTTPYNLKTKYQILAYNTKT